MNTDMRLPGYLGTSVSRTTAALDPACSAVAATLPTSNQLITVHAAGAYVFGGPQGLKVPVSQSLVAWASRLSRVADELAAA